MYGGQNPEILDTGLCYQALGVCISDPPQLIEETYERLVRKYKAEFNSIDPSIKEAAREQLAIIERMYHTITCSVSYASKAKDQNKAVSAVGNRTRSERRITSDLANCPSCSAPVSKAAQSCPFCRAVLLTPWKKFQRKYFTMTNLLLFLIATVSISLVAALVQSNFMH
ncbi:zinc ribbon domain-containing protein [Citrifermentans bremense]|uniref:zinc ribbon domain-containing protein n=1 Tax=Citrifermentans bremense TaxID=60035 RepID=UPI000403F0F0|nr:zinc ribbon domain-containing protein [Citrifermentans bremense]